MSHTGISTVEDVMKKRVGFVVSLLLATFCFDAAFAQVGHNSIISALLQLFRLG
jgi:hypothetical protein